MPRRVDLEATRIIRSYSKEDPVIALTAYAFEADKEQALEAGCNDFVTEAGFKSQHWKRRWGSVAGSNYK